MGRQTLDTAPFNARHGDRLWTQHHVMQGMETDSGHSAMHFLRMNMDLFISVTTSHGSVL